MVLHITLKNFKEHTSNSFHYEWVWWLISTVNLSECLHVCFQEGLTMVGRVTLNMGGTDGLGPGLNRRKQALLPEGMLWQCPRFLLQWLPTMGLCSNSVSEHKPFHLQLLCQILPQQTRKSLILYLSWNNIKPCQRDRIANQTKPLAKQKDSKTGSLGRPGPSTRKHASELSKVLPSNATSRMKLSGRVATEKHLYRETLYVLTTAPKTKNVKGFWICRLHIFIRLNKFWKHLGKIMG